MIVKVVLITFTCTSFVSMYNIIELIEVYAIVIPLFVSSNSYLKVNDAIIMGYFFANRILVRKKHNLVCISRRVGVFFYIENISIYRLNRFLDLFLLYVFLFSFKTAVASTITFQKPWWLRGTCFRY